MANHSSVRVWRIPRDRGAWWAAVYGVAQSQTRLKQLSSSSSYLLLCNKYSSVKDTAQQVAKMFYTA